MLLIIVLRQKEIQNWLVRLFKKLQSMHLYHDRLMCPCMCDGSGKTLNK